MKLTIDVENTVTKRDDRKHLDPFEPTNRLVLVGAKKEDNTYYIFDEKNNFCGLQELLDQATILIGHNIAYDLVWLWECGFKYDGPVFDTMLAEYVLQRGIKEPLSLEACAERNKLYTQKQDTLKEYLKKGLNVDEIPRVELIEYLQADLKATHELSDRLYKKLNTVEHSGLMNTVLLTNEVAICLAKMYHRGFKVDKDKLQEVCSEFKKEKVELEKSLQEQVRKLMGDTPINLNSPEQLSWVIYGRKVNDKDVWSNSINPYMADSEFRTMIKRQTTRLFKTKAKQCSVCFGNGRIRKVKKDGTLFSQYNRCKPCNASGFIYINSDSYAGLKFRPPTPKWTSANGFTTSKSNLEILERLAKTHNMHDAVDFL